MGKLYVKIDDRLIHGQIVTAWGLTLGIQRIIAVDDKLANNPTLKSIMMMGIPKDLNGQIVTSDEAKEMLQDGFDKTTLLITRQCRNLDPVMDLIKNAEHINSGKS